MVDLFEGTLGVGHGFKVVSREKRQVHVGKGAFRAETVRKHAKILIVGLGQDLDAVLPLGYVRREVDVGYRGSSLVSVVLQEICLGNRFENEMPVVQVKQEMPRLQHLAKFDPRPIVYDDFCEYRSAPAVEQLLGITHQ